MIFLKVVPKGDERIIRLIKREPSEVGQIPIIRSGDFERLMGRHSGISMWRESALALALSKYTVKGSKGVLEASAKDILALNLDFYDMGNDHFSIRCPGCDLSQKQFDERPLCQVPGGTCGLAPNFYPVKAEDDITPLKISDKMVPLFTVHTDLFV